MFEEHYSALLCGYAAASLGWVIASRTMPMLWPTAERAEFKRPWTELGFAMLAAIGVILIGALYSHGIRIRVVGPFRPLAETVNQICIFAPMLLLIPLRRQGWSTAWLSPRKLAQRLGVGVVLAVLAVVVYSLCRKGSLSPAAMLVRIVRYQNLDLLVQVFLEDFSIAVLFVRVTAVMGARWSLVTVAILFAAGHIPTMITQGASPNEFGRLALDVCLGVAVLAVIRRSRDIVWFAPVHFCMDMTQFARVTFGSNS